MRLDSFERFCHREVKNLCNKHIINMCELQLSFNMYQSPLSFKIKDTIYVIRYYDHHHRYETHMLSLEKR